MHLPKITDFNYKIQRIRFEQILEAEIVPYFKENSSLWKNKKQIVCAISYAWGNKEQEDLVEELAEILEQAGLTILLDRWYDRSGLELGAFIEKMFDSDYVLVIGTPPYLQKYEKVKAIKNNDQLLPYFSKLTPGSSEHVLRAEVRIMRYLVIHSEQVSNRIIPLLWEGTKETALPFLLRSKLSRDFVNIQDSHYFQQVLILLKDLYSIDNRDKKYRGFLNNLNVAVKVVETKSLPAKNQYESQQQQERDEQEKQEAQNADSIIKNLLSKSPAAAFAKNNVNTLSLKEKPERNLRKSNLQGLDFKEEIELAGIAGSQKPQMNAQKEQNNFITDHNLEERNQKFVGREQFFERIYQFLQRKEKSVITYTIQGLGGIGKTQLALEYAYRRLKDYRLVWRLNGENIESDYAQLADSLGVSLINTPNQQQLIRAVNSKLKNKDKWLLIIDNAPSYEAIKLYLPTGPGHVLITSRSTANWQTKITLEVFDRKESIAYFKNELSELINKNKANLINDADFEKQANRLAALLGDLPLALAQAAAYINQAETDLAAYTKLFVQKRKELWSQEEPPRDYNNTIKTTWSISLKSLNDKSFEHY